MPSFETVYIDPDEEVPSVIARVKSSTASFLICVVPQRALLFSSVITMRLLKKEADRFSKDVFVVTQDEQGSEVARRAGFVVKKTLEEVPFYAQKVSRDEKSDFVQQERRVEGISRLRFDGEYVPKMTRDENATNSLPKKSIRTEDIRVPVVRDPEAMRGKDDDAFLRDACSITQKLEDGIFGNENEGHNAPSWEEEMSKKNSKREKLYRMREKTTLPPSRRCEKIGSRAQWIIFFSLVIVLGMSACMGMYLQSPEAEVTVYAIRQSVSEDVGYIGNAEDGEIAVRFLEYEDTVTDTGEASGLGSTSGTRATGTVTLYNAFSKEPQSLVATTRLQTAEEKIVRIVQPVTIPGYVEKDGEIVPGTVQVKVQADEPGEGGNIVPAKFIIPGFSNQMKKEKIYAESQDALTGGSSGGSSDRIVSQRDVEMVRKKMEQRTRETIFEKAKNDMASGTTVGDLIDVTFVSESVTPTVGMATRTFSVEARVRVHYAVFSGDNARTFAAHALSEKSRDAKGVFDANSVTIEYGKISADFEKKSVNIKMFATADLVSEVPVDALREDMAGKNESELQSVMEKYPQIARFEVQLNKAYFQKNLPSDPSRIRIQVTGE